MGLFMRPRVGIVASWRDQLLRSTVGLLESGGSCGAGALVRCCISSSFDRTCGIARHGTIDRGARDTIFSFDRRRHIHLISVSHDHSNSQPAYTQCCSTLSLLVRSSHARRPRAPGSPYGGRPTFLFITLHDHADRRLFPAHMLAHMSAGRIRKKRLGFWWVALSHVVSV
jgi:hypothetical protein